MDLACCVNMCETEWWKFIICGLYFCITLFENDCMQNMLFAGCCVESQMCRKSVTLSSLLELCVLNPIYQSNSPSQNQTARLQIRQLVSRSDSLSESRTACLKVGHCVTKLKTGWVKLNLWIGLCSSFLFGNAASLKPEQFVNLDRYNPKTMSRPEYLSSTWTATPKWLLFLQSLFVVDITDDQQCFATAMALVCKDLTFYVINCQVAFIY